MKTKAAIILLFVFSVGCARLFAGSPQLVWHQTYGESVLVQQVTVMAIDNYDNMFVAGFVNFGSYGNIIVNRYDGVGNLMWNRLYNNTQTSAANDIPVGLFPDNVGGVLVLGYINGPAITTHILGYNGGGSLQTDYELGDTTAGSKTFPFAVVTDGVYYYMLGQLNNVSSIFKCDGNCNLLWSTPLHNNFNNQVGSLGFDPFGNVVVGVTDSATAQVIIHRYNQYSGSEAPGFNTHISSMPVNGNYIHTAVDQNSNIFLAAIGTDTGGRTQLVVDKFDTTGTLQWSTMCNSSKGYSNVINSFLLDNVGDVLVSGPFTDDTDNLQYGAVYQISGDSGGVNWSFVDSQFLVNEAVTQVDVYGNVYLSTTKTPSTISSNYSQFSCTQLTQDSGDVQWNRSFDNSSDNTGLIAQVNNFGDLFLATNTPTDTCTEWFMCRIGNAANDSVGTEVKTVVNDIDNLTVFPNPFSATTNASFTSLTDEKLSLKLYDAAGRLIQQQEVQGTAGVNLVTFNTAVTGGVYLVKLEGVNFLAVKPVVIY